MIQSKEEGKDVYFQINVRSIAHTHARSFSDFKALLIRSPKKRERKVGKVEGSDIKIGKGKQRFIDKQRKEPEYQVLLMNLALTLNCKSNKQPNNDNIYFSRKREKQRREAATDDDDAEKI
jgi:hypothetical protein